MEGPELASETAVRRATVKTADAYPVRSPRTLLTVVGLPSVMALLFVTGRAQAQCNAGLRELSTDPFTNSTSQHRTEVEPDTFAFGSTIVAALQVGRFFDGGASDIGWATSTDGGTTWSNGLLSGITKFQGSGPYDRVSDPSVAYDARHDVWLISSLALREVGGSNPPVAPAVVVSRSRDGGLTWANPAVVATGRDLDKNWTVCDTTATSPFYGNCYTQYDDVSTGDQLRMATSTDGGLTWSEAAVPSMGAAGGQPVVQRNGTVIVPLGDAYLSSVRAVTSTDGGLSYAGPVRIAPILAHPVAGNLRSPPLPSAEIDGAGRVYVVWQDCRFRSGCASNDIVMSTSSNGTAWSPVVRIPIDDTTSAVDHFIPGLAVDKATAGSSAHLGLTYYYYPQANCSTSTCQLDVGFISSSNGGASWSTPMQLAGPMSLGWLARTNQGAMVADYISTSFAGGTAHGVFALANAPSGGCGGSLLDEAVYTTRAGLVASGGSVTSSGERAVVSAGEARFATRAPVTIR